MRRFELVEGTSSKFWEVEVEGTELTVRFGRIGTNGQTKTKSFATAAAAAAERDGLVKEKTGKGYKEVAVGADAKLAPVAAAKKDVAAAAPASAATHSASDASATATTPATPGAPAAPTATPAAAPGVNASAASPRPAPPPASLSWPSGGFQWTDELRAQLPPVRGLRAVALPEEWAAATPPRVQDRGRHQYMLQMRTEYLTELGAVLGRTFTPWSDAELRKQLSDAALRSTDHDFWIEVQAQCMGPGADVSELSWVVYRGVVLHGLAFMLEATQPMWTAVGAGWAHGANGQVQLDVLRSVITFASDEQYAPALEYAESQQGADVETRIALASLFPHLPWGEELASAGVEDTRRRLTCCDMQPATAYAYFKKTFISMYGDTPALLRQVELHGEAALDLLALAVAKSAAQGRQPVEEALRLLVRMQVPELVDRLVALIESREARTVLDRVAESHPAAVLLRSFERAMATRHRLTEGWAVRLALRKPDALAAVRGALDDGARARLDTLLAAFEREEVPAESLPELLRSPPWLQKKRAQELPTLTVTPMDVPDRLTWTDEERDRAAKFQAPPHIATHVMQKQKGARNLERALLTELYILPAAHDRVLRGEAVQPEDIRKEQYYYGAMPSMLLLLPHAAALAVWNTLPARLWTAWGGLGEPVGALLAKYGTKALPGLVNHAQADPADGLKIAMIADSAALVPIALHALRNTKKARAIAADWMHAHLDTTLRVALPMAFGSDRAGRDNAQYGLRSLCASGHEARAKQIASDYGPDMSAALQALLDADPLLVLPTRMPKLPAFFVPASFRRPELRGGGAVPVATAEHIGMMLAISKLDEQYAGLQVVRDACDPDSLAEFVWDLFEAWLSAGAPSKEGWAFTALGLLGNDETARRLTPRIREWPGEAAHARAVTGLDLLAAIGTDMALMHLNAIANKVKFKGLQDRAREKIAAVAEARGFTAEELADRLVPDLGLEESGTLELNFGPRRFTVGFDETLKPFVRDSEGTRLKDLPKPIRTDDATLAGEATERYKQLKKDAKAVATIQIMRMELGMIARRRWSAADVRRFFLEHPLLRHLAARVVWGVYEDGRMTSAFRVAEDRTLADATDSLATVADDATVGIAHVLEMPQELQTAFGQVFADYEILQPFRQLGRETFRLTDEELRTNEITRFKDKVVSTGSVMGLSSRGWNRGMAEDGGWVGYFYRDVGNDLRVDLELDPGTIVGDTSYEPKQKIPRIVLRKQGSWSSGDVLPLKQLDPIVASEVLRDAELLAPFKE